MKALVEKVVSLLRHKVLLATSLSKGFLLALGAVAAVALVLFLIALSAGVLGLEVSEILESSSVGLDSLWVLAIWTILLAAGGFLTSGDQSNFAELQFAPSLLSLLLALAVYKIARSQAASSRTPAIAAISSVTLAFGFSLGLAALGWLAQGLLSVQPPTFASLFLVGALASLVGLIASSRDAEGKSFSTRTTWVLAAAGRYFLMVSVATASLIALALVYLGIEPDFAMSEPTPPEVVLTALETFQLTLAIFAVLLFAPTLFFTAVMALSGASFGFTLPNEFASQIAGLANIDLDNQLSTSMIAWLGLWIIPLALSLIIAPALMAGARSTKKFSYEASRGSDFAALGLFVFVSMLALHHLSELRVAAFSVAEDVTDEVGVVAGGTSLVAVAPWVILGSIAIYLASRHWSSFLAGAFPRIVIGKSFKTNPVQRTLAMQLTGRITSTVVIGAMVAAIGIVSTERIVAAVDSPESRAKSLIDTLDPETVEEFKKRYTNTGNGSVWFEDEILLAGLPSAETSLSFATNNLNDREWSVGDLDAVTVATWALDAGTASAKISFTHDLRDDFFIDRAVFSPKLEPSRVTLSFDPKLEPMIVKKDREILVNGSKVAEGQYMMLPGSYKIDFPGYKLVAPFNETVFSSAEQLNQIVEIPPTINFPGNSKDRLTDQALNEANSCEVSGGWDLECLGVTISRAGTGAKTTGVAPASYYDFADSGLSVKSVVCESVSFQLLRADRIKATAVCDVEVAFSRQYFDSASVRRCAFSFWGFCFRYQTVIVRGASLGKLNYTNLLEKKSSLTAVLRGNDLVVEPAK